MHSICHDDILAHLKSNVDFHYLLRGFKGSFVRGAQYMYLLTFGAGQKINPCHGTMALVRMTPLSLSNNRKRALIEGEIQKFGDFISTLKKHSTNFLPLQIEN